MRVTIEHVLASCCLLQQRLSNFLTHEFTKQTQKRDVFSWKVKRIEAITSSDTFKFIFFRSTEFQFSVSLPTFKAQLLDKLYFINVLRIMSFSPLTPITHAPFDNFSLIWSLQFVTSRRFIIRMFFISRLFSEKEFEKLEVMIW